MVSRLASVSTTAFAGILVTKLGCGGVGSDRVGTVVVDWSLTPLLIEDNVDDIVLLNRELSSLVGDCVGEPSEEAALDSCGALAVGVSPGVLAPWEVDTIASRSVSPLLGVASGNSAPGNTCAFLASTIGHGSKTRSTGSGSELEAGTGSCGKS